MRRDPSVFPPIQAPRMMFRSTHNSPTVAHLHAWVRLERTPNVRTTVRPRCQGLIVVCRDVRKAMLRLSEGLHAPNRSDAGYCTVV